MLMALVLSAQVAISPEAMGQAWQELIALLAGMQTAASNHFGLDPRQPHLGLALSTRELPGTIQRLTIVDGVLADSAAQRAGIRAGDIVVAIGNRELDAETLKAVSLYLSDWSDEVPLTIRRGDTRQKVNVRRAPIPCLQTMYDQFPAALWHKRIGALLRRSLVAKGKLERSTSNPWAPLESRQIFEKLKEDAQAMFIVMNLQLDSLACVACRVVQ